MQQSDIRTYLLQRIQQIQPELVEMRRALHRIPEVEFEEHKTAAFLKTKLDGLGLKPETGLGGTGLSALIRGTGQENGSDSKKKTLLIRSDMDALPVTELTGLPYASETPGVMHACGHDAHMTMIYGAAKLLSELQHCILAHHGEMEFGSPKTPELIEAFALHMADNTDAKLETFSEAVQGKDADKWLGINRPLGGNIRRTSKWTPSEENG